MIYVPSRKGGGAWRAYLAPGLNDFLERVENKVELFKFLSNILVTLDTPDQVVATMGEQVLCKYPKSTENLAPCNHEEADTRCFVHMMDAIEEGQSKFLIRTVDSDVVVLAVAMMQKVKVEEIWVAFGTGKRFKYIAIHELHHSLGPRKAITLPFFHAFTGCDTVSYFHSKGKKTCWKI